MVMIDIMKALNYWIITYKMTRFFVAIKILSYSCSCNIINRYKYMHHLSSCLISIDVS
jgi:hypothetical protein